METMIAEEEKENEDREKDEEKGEVVQDDY